MILKFKRNKFAHDIFSSQCSHSPCETIIYTLIIYETTPQARLSHTSLLFTRLLPRRDYHIHAYYLRDYSPGETIIYTPLIYETTPQARLSYASLLFTSLLLMRDYHIQDYYLGTCYLRDYHIQDYYLGAYHHGRLLSGGLLCEGLLVTRVILWWCGGRWWLRWWWRWWWFMMWVYITTSVRETGIEIPVTHERESKIYGLILARVNGSETTIHEQMF